ncbi:uncharacterized protein LOC143285550 isoform X3 [Babylonia areolata]|uniref:uncharacterized protein LOC143285550 isoform X3 n=1 Tax=Babylonia areolata TaxID=304850 RepID=UPI003FD67DBD
MSSWRVGSTFRRQQREKPVVVGPTQAEGKALKRKLLTSDPVDDEADKKVTAAKRKRPIGFDASSPDPGNSSSPRGGSGNVRSHGVPLSERQQMAMLMRMTDETSQGDSSPKPSSPPPSVTSTKRTPADKKVNKRNERGETPLHIAAKRGDVKHARRLIKSGASVNVADYAGWTPLHEACNLGNVDVAKQLLKAGASVNVLGLGDESPLHDAAINNHRKLVGILLKHGANPLQTNIKGQTPVDVANDANIKKLLNREIVSSNSDTSSVEEVTSPTSPDSLASIKDDDRGLDVEEIKPRSSSMSMVKGDNSYSLGGSFGNRRLSLPPKSPVDKPLSSPRLFLKFKSAGSSSGEEAGPNQGQSNRKSTDSKEPMFKSYILTMDTGDQQQQQQQQQQLQPPSHHGRERGGGVMNRGGGSGRPSPSCSPVSSMEVGGEEGARRSDLLPPFPTDHHHHPHPHHNQHHHHKARGGPDNWDSIMRIGGGGVGGGGGGGGGSQNSVAAPCPSSTPSSSSSTPLTLPSLKVQCVRPDSSEEESGFPSSQGPGPSLQRLRTEPFTPQPLEEVSDDEDDDERGGGGVFRTGVRTSRLQQNAGGAASRLSPGVTGGGGGGNSGHHLRDSQHIPASMEGVNHSTSASSSSSSTGRHRISHQAGPVLEGGSVGVCVSRTGSGVSSTTGGSSSAASGVEKDSLIAPGPADRTSQPANHPHSSSRRSSGGGGGGSISCVSSSSVASEGSVPVTVSSGGGGVSHTNATSAPFLPSSNLHSNLGTLRWETQRSSLGDRGDRASPKAFPPSLDLLSAEKSDSSASSPLRMDIDENMSSSPRSDRDNESRLSSCPKVPPLKIILPSQKASATPHAPDQTKNLLSKPALPYVLNPTTQAAANTGQWTTMDVTDSDEGTKPPPTSLAPMLPKEENSLTMNTPSPAPPSRPSSRTGSSERDENRNSAGKGALPESSSSSVTREELTSNGKEEEEGGDREEEESRPTRTLRSHTAMKQQQEQKQQKTGGGQPKVEPNKETQDRVSKADSREFAENKDDGSGEPASDSGGAGPNDEIPVHPRKRKLRAKTEAQTREQAENRDIVLEKPPNPYELYLNLRRQQMLNRHKLMNSVTPKPPNGFKDYLMVNCTYVLQGNATSTLSVPMLTPPNSVTGPMRELFEAQERARYRLRLQHHIEREKLMLAIEQEILREHARAARAVANQNQPLSVCTILCEEEIYNLHELDQVDERDKSSRSRYNGRQFLSWLQDVGDKYNNIKNLLLLRHHHEAESLHAVQKMDWEWKLKECGQCDYKTTPVIDDLHLPMVQVNDEFELLPPQRLRLS